MMYRLYQDDCLQAMQKIPDRSIDAIITDPPYGTTACKWDSVIPFKPMWTHLTRIIKPRGAIVLFASQPFTSALIMSNVKMFKYTWIWNKNNSAGFATAKYRPFIITEDICIFAEGSINYNPQMEIRGTPRTKGWHGAISDCYGLQPIQQSMRNNIYYPKNIIAISKHNHSENMHPAQKPVALLEYLIKTYTNPDDTVLDFAMGSGTTGVAALQTGRQFIGIEQDAGYFEIAQSRIQQVATALQQLPMEISS